MLTLSPFLGLASPPVVVGKLPPEAARAELLFLEVRLPVLRPELLLELGLDQVLDGLPRFWVPAGGRTLNRMGILPPFRQVQEDEREGESAIPIAQSLLLFIEIT
jgi:hypothetical protein